MAITAIAAAAALASAGAGVYGAVKSGSAQRQGNENNQAAFNWNKQVEQENQQLQLIRALQDTQQRDLDNRRYDEAIGREDKQRQFTNALATGGQTDAQGNRLFWDPTTNSWRTQLSQQGRDEQARTSQQRSTAYSQSVAGQNTGGMQAADRLSQGGTAQAQARALGQELMGRYAASQGRTPQQMEGASIERNVANVTDPLRTGGNMAMLQGYRQGNSGNDALMGALARQSQGGTRAAIADARYAAPTASADERGAAAKALLSPATTLMERGMTSPGNAAPMYEGSSGIDKLMSSIQRNNPAGVGTSLNPRSAGVSLGQGAGGNLKGFEPANADGTQWASAAEALRGLTQPNGALMKYLNQPKYQTAFNGTAPVQPASDALQRSLLDGGGNFTSNGIVLS